MKKTVEEVLKIFNDLGYTPKRHDRGDYWKITDDNGDEVKLSEDDIINEVGNIKQVHQYGGEGEGDHYEVVIHLEEHDLYFAGYGYYVSHDGVHWDDNSWTQVEPVKVEVLQYLSVNRKK